MENPEGMNALNSLAQRGIAALEDEDYEEAIACFRKALKQAPFRQDIKSLLAVALDRKPLRKTSAALSPPQVKQKAPAGAESPRRNIRIGVWLLIFSALCLISLAFFFFFSSAIQTFLSNVAKRKDVIEVSPSEREATALYKTAELLQDQRRYSEAIEAIRKALEKNPANQKQFEDKLAALYYEKGEFLYKKDEYSKAIASYEKAAQHNPDSPEYYYGLGWAYYIQGRKNQNRHRPYRSYFEKALKAFGEVLKREPANLRAKNALARVYIARNETTKAAKIYREIIRLDTEGTEAERARRALRSMGFKP